MDADKILRIVRTLEKQLAAQSLQNEVALQGLRQALEPASRRHCHPTADGFQNPESIVSPKVFPAWSTPRPASRRHCHPTANGFQNHGIPESIVSPKVFPAWSTPRSPHCKAPSFPPLIAPDSPLDGFDDAGCYSNSSRAVSFPRSSAVGDEGKFNSRMVEIVGRASRHHYQDHQRISTGSVVQVDSDVSMKSAPFASQSNISLKLSYSDDLPLSISGRWAYLHKKLVQYYDSHFTTLHPVWTCQKLEQRARTDDAPQTALSASTGMYRVSSVNPRKSVKEWARSTSFSKRTALRIPVQSPFCLKRLLWDGASSILIVYELILFPWSLFGLDAGMGVSNDSAVVHGIEIFIASFWVMDILMSALTGYLTPEGYLVMDFRRVLQQYAKSWFLFDLTLVVVDMLLTFSVIGDSGSLLTFVKNLRRFLKMLRLLRLLRLLPKVRDHLGEINSESFLTIMHLLICLAVILLLNHYIASGWCHYWKHPLQDPNDVVGLYFIGLHWAVATSTLGSMDIFPDTNLERLWTIGTLVFSLIIFSTFISNINEATGHLGEIRHRRALKERAIRRYLMDYYIPRKLSCEIWRFVRRNNLTQENRIHDAEVEVFQLLPVPIREKLRYEAFRPHLVHHPFFDWLEAAHTGLLKQLCIHAVQTLVVKPYSAMFWSSATGVNRMIFLASGCLEYCPEHDETVGIFEITSGMWACEEILWCRSALLSGMLTAGSSLTNLVLLVPQEFQDIIRGDFHCRRVAQEYAKLFVQRFNEASLDLDYVDLLFNSPVPLEDMLDKACACVYGKSLRERRLKGNKASVNSVPWLAFLEKQGKHSDLTIGTRE